MEAAKHDVERKSLDQRHQMSDLERLRHSCVHVLATAVLRHRLILSAAAEIEGREVEGIVDDLIESTEAPR